LLSAEASGKTLTIDCKNDKANGNENKFGADSDDQDYTDNSKDQDLDNKFGADSDQNDDNDG